MQLLSYTYVERLENNLQTNKSITTEKKCLCMFIGFPVKQTRFVII